MVHDPLLGTVLGGQFRVLSRLGEGGMGVVYLVEHTALQRREALKILSAQRSRDENAVARFRREAKASTRLSHPNVINFYDLGQLPDRRLYMSMEFVEGESLAALNKKEGPLPLPRIYHLLAQIVAAIEHAHERGVVHRDLKPENVIITSNRRHSDVVKILDFGIAKIIAADYKESKALTPYGGVFGTPAYMAPEQAMGKGIDHRCDLYSIGCIAYELVVGKTPFSGNMIQQMHGHMMEVPPTPMEEAMWRKMPVELDLLIRRCLEKDLVARFQTATDLAAALARVPGFGTYSPEAAGAPAGFDPKRTTPDGGSSTYDSDSAATEQFFDFDARRALNAFVRQAAEKLLSHKLDNGLVQGLAAIAQIEQRMVEHMRELARVTKRADALEESMRHKEKDVREELSELYFAQSTGAPVDEAHVIALKDALAEIRRKADFEIDRLTDEAVNQTAKRALAQDELDATYRRLEASVDSMLASFPELLDWQKKLSTMRHATEAAARMREGRGA